MPTEPNTVANDAGKPPVWSAAAPVAGLVLAGGESRRMGRDKAALELAGTSQLERTMALLSRHLPQVFVSVRESQQQDPLR